MHLVRQELPPILKIDDSVLSVDGHVGNLAQYSRVELVVKLAIPCSIYARQIPAVPSGRRAYVFSPVVRRYISFSTTSVAAQ